MCFNIGNQRCTAEIYTHGGVFKYLPAEIDIVKFTEFSLNTPENEQ